MATFSYSIQMKDAFNRTTRRGGQVEAIDFDAAQLAVTDYVGAVAAMLLVGVVSYRVWQDTDFATVIAAGSNIDQGATFVWELNVLLSGKKAVTRYPGPSLTIFDANGNLDLLDPLVLAVRTQLLAGSIRISDGEVAVDLLSGQLDK